MQVETDPESLDLGQVFLLDCGEVLFVWCGSRSSLMSRSKARLLAEKINKFERKGHSKIIQLRPVRLDILMNDCVKLFVTSSLLSLIAGAGTGSVLELSRRRT